MHRPNVVTGFASSLSTTVVFNMVLHISFAIVQNFESHSLKVSQQTETRYIHTYIFIFIYMYTLWFFEPKLCSSQSLLNCTSIIYYESIFAQFTVIFKFLFSLIDVYSIPAAGYIRYLRKLDIRGRICSNFGSPMGKSLIVISAVFFVYIRKWNS